MKHRCVIVDIDGTVAIHEGDRGHFEWALVPDDLPNESVVELVYELMHRGHRILYVSGREAVCRDDTLTWLDSYDIGIGDDTEHALYMRPTGDYRADTIVKREIYERDIKPHYYVWLVLDDRDSVVEMWRGLGLTCLQVARGDF